MKNITKTKKVKTQLCLVASALGLAITASNAAVTVDFDPTGEFGTQFSGGGYSESPTGGLSSSIGVVLTTSDVTSFDGASSESFATNFRDRLLKLLGAFLLSV
jgi:hypothetical protein